MATESQESERDFVATSPPVKADKIRLVCATRLPKDDFFKQSALGRSLPYYRTFPRGQPIELRLFSSNAAPLPFVYNQAIDEAAADPAILVFLHDDVYLNDFYWARHLHEGLAHFHVVGLAGNRRRAVSQASWMFLDDTFRRDDDANLSGVLGHGQGFPDLLELSVYGSPGQEVKLLDGVFHGGLERRLATRRRALRSALPIPLLRPRFLPAGRDPRAAHGYVGDLRDPREPWPPGRERMANGVRGLPEQIRRAAAACADLITDDERRSGLRRAAT
jgi:hypothetical protein